MVSEASDKIFEEFLKSDIKKSKTKEKVKKIEPEAKAKILGVETSLKDRLLAKQRARKESQEQILKFSIGINENRFC